MLKAIEIKPDVFWVGGIGGTSTTSTATPPSAEAPTTPILSSTRRSRSSTPTKPFTGGLIDRIAISSIPRLHRLIVSRPCVEMDHSGSPSGLMRNRPESHYRHRRAQGRQGTSPIMGTV
ncbi:MAG: hypothetical protein ACLTDR_08860 [Adlercreutzia equolifaciens]